MKAFRFCTLLIALFTWVPLSTRALKDLAPASVAVSPNQLFYLQRSKDANTVIYEANVLAGKTLDPNKPVRVYWIRYAEKGQREDLSHIQWKMAYGYKHKPLSTNLDAYDVSLNAFEKRPLRVTYHEGKPVAMTLINGKRACLRRVFVQVDPKAQLIPHVQFIDMYGSTVDTAQPIHERIVI